MNYLTPSKTARVPPGQKSFWISITKKASDKTRSLFGNFIFQICEHAKAHGLNYSIDILVQRDPVNAFTIASPISAVLRGVTPASPNKSWVLEPFANTFSIDCSNRSASAPSSKL